MMGLERTSHITKYICTVHAESENCWLQLYVRVQFLLLLLQFIVVCCGVCFCIQISSDGIRYRCSCCCWLLLMVMLGAMPVAVCPSVAIFLQFAILPFFP